MEVTALTPGRRRRIRVYLDGEFAASVDAESLARAGICVGARYTEEEFAEILRGAEVRAAKEKALNLLTRRDHSRAELEEKIARECDAEAAAKAAAEMERLGLINDAEFAKKFARELCLQKCFSTARALREMSRRGVPRALAEEALEDLTPDPQEQLARLLQKKFPRGVGSEKDLKRACALLQRYGYPWDEIHAAVSRFGVEEQDAD